MSAQDAAQAPAHLAIVDGRATLEREGEIEDAAGGVPFVTGDRLRTEAGRVEIIFPDGSSLDVDEFTSIDLLSPTLVRMTAGRALLRVAGADNPSEAVRYQIDTAVASVVTDGPGEFRVALFSGPSGMETELAVLRGWASLTTERGSTAVRAGERSLARDNLAPMPAQTFNSARFDAFDRWAEARRVERAGTAASARYLPDDLRVYGGTFDRNGTWQYEAPYGYVWYPTVAGDWRPYFDGYWSAVQPYGWTWIGIDVWSWPTHHYGRWGYTSSRWYWIPERRWASAWVSWGAAPGYVSWCPLGFDNRPVFGLSAHIGNSWAGWTVVPRTNFGRDHVRRWAVDSRRLGGDTPRLTNAGAPVLPRPTRAVPRNAGGAAGALPGASAAPRASGRGPAPVDSRPPRGENAGGRWAVPRQPSGVENAPTLGSVPTFDRTTPTTPNAQRRQPPDGWLRQPLPPAAPRPNPPTPAASDATARGNPNAPPRRTPHPQGSDEVPTWTTPGAAVTRPSTPRAVEPAGPVRPQIEMPGNTVLRSPRGRDGVPTWTAPGAAVTRPSTPRAVEPAGPIRPQIEMPGNTILRSPRGRDGVPTWTTPGAEATRPSMPRAVGPSGSVRPQIEVPANAAPRSPGPRWSGYGDPRGGSPPSRTEPPSENRSSAPAARERPAPPYREQSAARPRGESGGGRPSGGDSGGQSGAGSSAGASTRSGSGGGGARQRHP